MDSSVVVISSDEDDNDKHGDMSVYSTPRTSGSATKRKRDHLLDIERQELEESLNSSAMDLTMSDKGSPEMKRKNALSPRSAKTSQVVKNEDLFDRNLPETVTLLTTPHGAKVYVVGTAHFSHQSQEDVSNVIRGVQPHFVVVELCSARTDIMLANEEAVLQTAKDLNFNKMLETVRASGVVQGLMYITLLSMSAHVTRELGMAPGGEFRRAYGEAQRVPHCHIILGDRPINITIARALAGLSWWQCAKLLYNIIAEKESISKEDVEKYKKRDFLERMVAELGDEFPSLKEVLVTERDKFLCYKIQQAAQMGIKTDEHSMQPCRTVAVVGIGHVNGIQKHWMKIGEEEMARITTIPPKKLSSKILSFTVRASMICGILYGIHKITPTPFNKIKAASNFALQYAIQIKSNLFI